MIVWCTRVYFALFDFVFREILEKVGETQIIFFAKLGKRKFRSHRNKLLSFLKFPLLYQGSNNKLGFYPGTPNGR